MSGGAVLPRLAGAGGVVWGTWLLLHGDEVWRRVEHREPETAEELGIRFLGGRHLVQGLAQLVAPRATSGLAVGVDVVHAASMGALAAVSPTRRRAALVTGAVALAGAGITQLSRR